LWRDRAQHGRTDQAFGFRKPDVSRRTTAALPHREPSRAATGWPGCHDEAPDAELLAVLDQGLEHAGAYIDKLRLTFAEYLDPWRPKRPEVLC
jgi:hypothetical protein